MEPQAPVSKPVFPEPPKPKDNHWITIAAMAVFVLLSLGAIVFLYYQNQQLKTMLASYQTYASPSPLPTSVVPLMGYASGYDPSGPRFTLEFPTECQNGQPPIECTTKAFRIVVNPQAVGRGAATTAKISNVKIGNYLWERRIFLGSTVDFSTYSLTQDNTYYLIQVDYYPYSPSSQNYFEQILSTFKFVGPAASPSSSPSAKPVACTLEQKICPNGSLPKRNPDCSWDPCPTP